MSPYVGMARKQNGGYNASISVQTLIFHLVVISTRLKTVRSARWCCPNYTMAPRLVENVVKVTNLEVVKIEFRHLPFLLSFFLSFFSQPSALTSDGIIIGSYIPLIVLHIVSLFCNCFDVPLCCGGCQFDCKDSLIFSEMQHYVIKATLTVWSKQQ